MDKRGDKVDVNFEAIANLLSSASHQDQTQFVSYLLRKFGITERELRDLRNKEEATVPVEIFSNKLSCLEAIVKFLKEERQWDIKRISAQLNRSSKTVWATYYNSVKKFKQPFSLTKTTYLLPLSQFKNRTLSVLETVVLFLKDSCDLDYKAISALLKRDYKTIWGTYKKAKKKHGN